MRHSLYTLALAAAIATPAAAELRVSFIEGAPKDRLLVQNLGLCDLQNLAIDLDFKDSEGRLIFDVTAKGAGVEVFQPLDVARGASALIEEPTVSDGQTSLSLMVGSLAPKSEIVITADLDDQLGAREITVSTSEFAGTVLSVKTPSLQMKEVFGPDPALTLALEPCDIS